MTQNGQRDMQTKRWKLAPVACASAAMMLLLAGCGSDEPTEVSAQTDPPASENEDEQEQVESGRLSISSITRDNREAACEQLLGSKYEYGQRFGVDVETDASWNADIWWHGQDEEERTTAMRCIFSFEVNEETTGQINIIVARTDEDTAASIFEGDRIRLSEDSGAIGTQALVEGDDVIAGAQVSIDATDEDVEAFLTEEVLPNIEP